MYTLIPCPEYATLHPGPCDNDNGGCDQLCLPAPGQQRTCLCSIGFRLDASGTTCVSGQSFFFSEENKGGNLCVQLSLWIRGLPEINKTKISGIWQVVFNVSRSIPMYVIMRRTRFNLTPTTCTADMQRAVHNRVLFLKEGCLKSIETSLDAGNKYVEMNLFSFYFALGWEIIYGSL